MIELRTSNPPDDGGGGEESQSEDTTRDKKPKIRCPRCRWMPRAHDTWMCTCGCAWNTFDTGGRCPECSRKWHNTQCLACGEWSPHSDWYE